MKLSESYRWLIPVVIVVALVWASMYTVSETDLVIVTLFGRPTRSISDAGLHLKWPFESVLRFDRRLIVYDPGSSEFLTKDKKNLVLGSAVCWRITDPNRFLQTVGDATGAEMRLHDLVWATLAADIGRVDLSDLLSIEPGRARVQALGDQVRTSATVETERRFGIAVVDLSSNGSISRTEQVCRLRTHARRKRRSPEYRAQGEQAIRSRRSRRRSKLLAEAYRDPRTQGEERRRRGGTCTARPGRNPQFYGSSARWNRTEDLNDKTSIILSGDSELLKLLTQGKAPDAR